MPALAPAPTAFMLDLDGTLVDTLGDFVAVLNRVMADMALPEVSRAFVEHTIGQGSEHLIRRGATRKRGRCTSAITRCSTASTPMCFPASSRGWTR